MTIAGIDIESTGLEWKKGHRIIELAAIVYDLHGNEKGAFVQRYNPQRAIDPKAQAVHGITFEDVSKSPLFARDAAKLSALLSKAQLLVAHNGREFDVPFINHELRLAGAPTLNVPLIDTLEDARWATPFGKVPNLGELCFACGVPYDPEQAHGALYDVRVMMQAFFKARAKGFFQTPIHLTEEREAA